MLLAIAQDMETSQTGAGRAAKSEGLLPARLATETAASVHGAFRHASGFDLSQVVAEFRALRASVLALWRCAEGTTNLTEAIEEIARFNEAIDQAIAESIHRFKRDVVEHPRPVADDPAD